MLRAAPAISECRQPMEFQVLRRCSYEVHGNYLQTSFLRPYIMFGPREIFFVVCVVVCWHRCPAPTREKLRFGLNYTRQRVPTKEFRFVRTIGT